MRSRTLFAALTLGGAFAAASCGSDTNTSSPPVTAAPTATSIAPTSSAVDSTSPMPMDSSMSSDGPAPMDTHSMDTHAMDTQSMTTDPMTTEPMTTDGMHMGDAAPATGLTVQVDAPTMTAGESASLSFRVVLSLIHI